MNEPWRAPGRAVVRLAGVLAVAAGVASVWMSYWLGLTAALSGLALAGVLMLRGERSFRARVFRFPVSAVVVAVLGWAVFVALALVRSRAAGPALGAAGLAVAWTSGPEEVTDAQPGRKAKSPH